MGFVIPPRGAGSFGRRSASCGVQSSAAAKSASKVSKPCADCAASAGSPLLSRVTAIHLSAGAAALSVDDWKEFLTAHQVTAAEYFRTYADLTVKQILKAQQLMTAFQQLLDEASS